MIFPRLNALSLWLLVGSMILLFSAFVVDGGVNCGWTFYVPLSTMNLSSVDLMLFALHMSGEYLGNSYDVNPMLNYFIIIVVMWLK